MQRRPIVALAALTATLALAGCSQRVADPLPAGSTGAQSVRSADVPATAAATLDVQS